MRIVLCDDERDVTITLEKHLRTYFEKNGSVQPEYVRYFSGETLLEDTGEIDIAFLDVKMEGINGINLGKIIRVKNPETLVIMVTSFMEYLDDAMRFHVFRYLPKPIDQKRLFRNMDDAIAQLRMNEQSHQTTVVKTQYGVFNIRISDIVYIEAVNHRTHVFTRNVEYITWESLDYWISTFDSNNFFQSHRSYLVNLVHVTNTLKNKLELCNGERTVPLAVKRKKAFREAYAKLLRCM